MPLDLSKPVQTRDGRKVRILCTDGHESWPIVGLIEGVTYPDVWRADGSYGAINPHADIVNVPEPERTGWVNIYECRARGSKVHDTKTAADCVALDTGWARIACIEVKYRPGQGLD